MSEKLGYVTGYIFQYRGVTIYEVSLIRLSPRCTSPVWTYSNCSPEERSDRYRVFNFVCAWQL